MRALKRIVIDFSILAASGALPLSAQVRGRGIGTGTTVAGQGPRGRGRAGSATASRLEQLSVSSSANQRG